MGRYFRNDLHDEFASWVLAYGGGDGPGVGLVAAVGAAVGDGDDGAFHEAWMAAGDRLMAEAAEAAPQDSRGRLTLWAAACYASSYHPLYGTPVDPRLVAAFRKQIAAFDAGLALLPHPVSPLRIPFEATTLPAYLLPAAGRETETRPLVILTNGYDATVTEMYFVEAVAASRAGFHCLFFDGPGQGELLIEQGIPMRPDWETVIRAVVDFAVALPGVDTRRIALWGWSLGGHLALRGASGEPRLAACIADPGLREVFSPQMLSRFGMELDGAELTGTLDEAALKEADAALAEVVKASPSMHWKLVQRGKWVHGAKSLGEVVAAGLAMTLEGRVGDIRCPTLLTTAEDDALSKGAEALHAELACPKTLLRFTAAEGAGDHCELFNRPLANLRMLDWLDATLGD